MSLQQELVALKRISNYDREPEKTFVSEVRGGVCGDCGRRAKTRKNGTLFKHATNSYNNATCGGSGEKPASLLVKCPECKQSISVHATAGQGFQVPPHPPGYTQRRNGETICSAEGLVGTFVPATKKIVF